MRTILRLDWRQVVQTKRNVVTLVVLCLFSLVFFAAGRHQQLGDLNGDAVATKGLIQQAADQLDRKVIPSEPKLLRTSNILAKQTMAASAMYLGAIFADNFDAQDGLLTLSHWELVVTRVMAKKQLVHRQIVDGASALEQLLPLVALALPFIVMILTADIWLSTTAHGSITATLPISLRQQALSKVLTRLALPLLAVAVVLALTTCASAVFGTGFGDLSYPMAIALGGHLIAVPLWLGALLLLGHAAVVILACCALMLCFNTLFHDLYLSLLAGFALCGLPLAFPVLARVLWFLPLAGLSPQALLQGDLQNEGGNWALGMVGADAILLLWTGALILLFSWLTSRQDVQAAS